MSSSETIRAKQNMEVLDVFKNLNSQVNAITKRQVSVFPDTLKPKTQRDMDTEVNVDKAIESINRTMEAKLTSLESMIGFLEFQNVGLAGAPIKQANIIPFQNAFTNAINTGDIIPLWNSVVRFYQKSGLSKQSQEMIKTKVLELEPNLEALMYGFQQTVDKVFQTRIFSDQIGMKMLDFLRTQSVYQLIKQQVDTSAFELISVSQLDTAFKNIFNDLTQDQRELLQSMAQRGVLGESPIRRIPVIPTGDFGARIRQLASELGVPTGSLPVDILKQLSQKDFQKWADDAMRGVKSQKSEWTQDDILYIQELDRKQAEVEDLVYAIMGIDGEIEELREQIVDLGDDFKIEDTDWADRLQDVPEIEPEPERPDPADYLINADPDEAGYEEAMAEYYRQEDEWRKANRSRTQIIDENNILREYAEAKDTESREELIREKEREIDELEEDKTEAEERLAGLEAELTDLRDKLAPSRIRPGMSKQQSNRVTRALDVLRRVATSAKRKTTVGRGKGSDVDTRGLSTLRQNYGTGKAESSEEEEEDSSEDEDENVFDFDDTRNEMYYTRPKK